MAEKSIPGIRVVDQWAKLGHENAKHWLFRVWDKYRRNYKSEAFAEKADGWAWAEREQARITLGESGARHTSFASLVADHVQSLTDAGREPVYVADVRRLLEHLVEKGVADMQADDFATRVRTVVAGLHSFAKGRTTPVGGKTRNRWLRQVRTCITHGLRTQRLRHDPLAPLRRFSFKEEQYIAETLSITEMRQMLANKHRDHPHFLVAALMVYAGARSREAVHFRWEWFDWKAELIRVRLSSSFKTKRHKERLIPLQPELAQLLQRWPDRQLHGYVVPDASLRSAKAWKLYDLFKAYLAGCGVERAEIHPHCTRHSWAGMMLATRASAHLVRRALGHTDLSTTDEYADAEMAYLQEVKGWPPGEFYLRRPAPADVAAKAARRRRKVRRAKAAAPPIAMPRSA